MFRNKKWIIAAISCLLVAFAAGIAVSGQGSIPPSVSTPASDVEQTTEEPAVIEPSVETTKRGRTTETLPPKTTTAPTERPTAGRTTTRASQVNAGTTSATAARCTVTFVSNGGAAVAGQTLLVGEYVKKPADPLRAGFTFAGWYKDAALTQPVNFKTDRVKGNVSVYAKWTKAVGTVMYTITFKGDAAGGGTVTASPAEALPGERVVLTVVLDEGKVLSKGTLKINGAQSEQLYFTMPAKNVVITAQFDNASVETDKDNPIGRKLLLLIGGLLLVCATLIVIAIAMRDKPIGETTEEWNAPDVVLSDYRDKPPQNADSADDSSASEEPEE